jgi:hypothetical protein
MNKLKKRIASAFVATSILAGGGIALAAPAEAASTHVYWFGTKPACDSSLNAARPGFGSYVRLVQGCVKNGNGYAYTVVWR